jgi:hypothetical protein
VRFWPPAFSEKLQAAVQHGEVDATVALKNLGKQLCLER